MIAEYGIYTDFEVIGKLGRCDHRGCPFPAMSYNFYDPCSGRYFEECICWSHFIKGSVPFSMEYEDADALCGVPRHRGKLNPGIKDRVLLASTGAHGVWLTPWGRQHKAQSSAPNGFRHAISKSRATWKSKRELAERKAEWEAIFPDVNKSSHFLDPIYNALGMENRTDDDVYSLCGEKVHKGSITGEPSCEACQRIAIRERVLAQEYASIKPRPKVVTLPKPIEQPPEFEELVAAGEVWADEDAFNNRRNWGERSGRAWHDKDKGVQRDPKLREDRGGVNRKRG
jgi:hypothetical protein